MKKIVKVWKITSMVIGSCCLCLGVLFALLVAGVRIWDEIEDHKYSSMDSYDEDYYDE